MPRKCCPYCGEVLPEGKPGRPPALSERDIARVRESYDLGESIRTLAREYGVSLNTIRKALNGLS